MPKRNYLILDDGSSILLDSDEKRIYDDQLELLENCLKDEKVTDLEYLYYLAFANPLDIPFYDYEKDKYVKKLTTREILTYGLDPEYVKKVLEEREKNKFVPDPELAWLYHSY